MASQRKIKERKRELADELARLRTDLDSQGAGLRQRFHPARRLATRLGKHPLRTFGATCLGTAVLTMLLRRKPKPRKERKERSKMKGFVVSTLLGAAQPVLKRWLIYMVKQKFAHRLNPPSEDSLLGQ